MSHYRCDACGREVSFYGGDYRIAIHDDLNDYAYKLCADCLRAIHDDLRARLKRHGQQSGQAAGITPLAGPTGLQTPTH